MQTITGEHAAMTNDVPCHVTDGHRLNDVRVNKPHTAGAGTVALSHYVTDFLPCSYHTQNTIRYDMMMMI